MADNVSERLGPMVRRLRLAAGLSQEELAERVSTRDGDGALDSGTVSRWEREARLVGPYWIGPLAAALGVPVEQMQTARGVSRALRRQKPPPAGATDPCSFPSVKGSPAPVVGNVARRTGKSDAELILRRTHSLRLADDVLAGVDLVEPVTRELGFALETYSDTSHGAAVGRRLLTGVAELAQLAGWVASDVEAADPDRHFRLGIAAAKRTGDGPLVGFLTGTYAYYLANFGNPRDALELAQFSVAATGADAPPRARASALDRLAWAATRAGEEQIALRAVEESAEALTRHQAGDDVSRRWLYWVGEAESTIMRARVYTELHRPLRAVPLLRSVLTDYDTTHTRELALYLSWLVMALLDANEPEEAASEAAKMLSMSASVPSLRAGGRRAVVVERLRERATVPAVAEVLSDWGA